MHAGMSLGFFLHKNKHCTEKLIRSQQGINRYIQHVDVFLQTAYFSLFFLNKKKVPS